MIDEEQHIVNLVIDRFIRDSKDLTVAEIAAGLGWTEDAVRRVIAKAHGCPQGLTCSQEARPSYSKNYRTMQSGTHKVWTYGPTRETLAKILKDSDMVLVILRTGSKLTFPDGYSLQGSPENGYINVAHETHGPLGVWTLDQDGLEKARKDLERMRAEVQHAE